MMIPILTPILSWQHGELTLIPAKSFHKHGLAGLGLSSKIETALLKTTPGFLPTYPQLGPSVFPPVGLVRSWRHRRTWAGGEGSG